MRTPGGLLLISGALLPAAGIALATGAMPTDIGGYVVLLVFGGWAITYGLAAHAARSPLDHPTPFANPQMAPDHDHRDRVAEAEED